MGVSTSKALSLESDLESRITKLPGPWTSIKIHIRHWPDRAFFGFNGRTIFMEFKRPGEEQTCGQRMYSKSLAGAGFHVYVIDTFEQGRDVLYREFLRK